jgi:hypothetical protein
VDVGVWGEVARGGGGVKLEEYTAGIILAGAPLDGIIALASYVSSTTRGAVHNSTCADALNRCTASQPYLPFPPDVNEELPLAGRLARGKPCTLSFAGLCKGGRHGSRR